MWLPQIARALFLRCPAETGECALSRGNSKPRVFLVSQRDAADDLAVGGTDNVHRLSAVGFDKCAIDVVRCYRSDGLLLCGCVQGASPSFKTSFGDALERALFEGRVTLIHVALPLRYRQSGRFQLSKTSLL